MQKAFGTTGRLAPPRTLEGIESHRFVQSERPGGEANLAPDISEWSVGRVNWLVCPVIGRMGLLSSLHSPLWVRFKSHRLVRFRMTGRREPLTGHIGMVIGGRRLALSSGPCQDRTFVIVALSTSHGTVMALERRTQSLPLKPKCPEALLSNVYGRSGRESIRSESSGPMARGYIRFWFLHSLSILNGHQFRDVLFCRPFAFFLSSQTMRNAGSATRHSQREPPSSLVVIFKWSISLVLIFHLLPHVTTQ
jgi:hypothetical protein